MLFTQRFWPGIADGSITLTFRRWHRAHVVAGRPYRTPAGIVEVTSVAPTEPAAITDDEARRAGHPDARALVADIPPRPGATLYRIEFHRVPGDPRADLAADADLDHAEVVAISARLVRLDRASRHGPWTRTTLELVRDRPATRAADLAASLDREIRPFKIDVRKLKNLGLTESLDVGYRLSPRGRAYLEATTFS
ncbi:MAG: hypothetical protein ACRDVN_05580 [Jiangellaceae bacterium]